MHTFSRGYFVKHYGSRDEKNPSHKLKAYINSIDAVIPKSKSKIKILDIGCGYGTFLKLLESDKRFETYGTDTSQFAIKKARQLTSKTKYWVANFTKFDPKIRFDVICAFDVLEHISNLDSALKKIDSLLAKNGHFICVVPVYDGPLGKIGGLLDKDITHVHKKDRHFWVNKLIRTYKILNIQGIVRYSIPKIGYVHVNSKYLANWGQAILISTSKK